jgi:hypothetical protein
MSSGRPVTTTLQPVRVDGSSRSTSSASTPPWAAAASRLPVRVAKTSASSSTA